MNTQTVMSQSEIEKINDKLDKVLGLLYNDVETGRKGLVQKLDDLEKVVDKMIISGKIMTAKRGVWMIVFSAIGGALVWLGKSLIVKIFFS